MPCAWCCLRRRRGIVAATSDDSAQGHGAARVPGESWNIGGRYQAAYPVELWDEPELIGPASCKLQAGSRMLLVSTVPVMSKGGDLAGLVLMHSGEASGWLSLGAAAQQQGGSSSSGSQGGVCSTLLIWRGAAWELQATYKISQFTILLIGPLLSSAVLGEVGLGESVRLLELALAEGGERVIPSSEGAGCLPRSRLRARVRTAGGLLGWLSPETFDGEALLLGPLDTSPDLWSGILARGGPAADREDILERECERDAPVSSGKASGRLSSASLGRLEVDGQEKSLIDERETFSSDVAVGSCGCYAARASPERGLDVASQGVTASFADSSPIERDALRSWAQGVYSRYNPAKLDTLPGLLSDYRGRETELVDRIADKYRVRPLPARLIGQPSSAKAPGV